MKKSKLLIVPLIGVASFLGIMVSSLDNVDAANNEMCSPEFFRDTYVANIAVNGHNGGASITNNSDVNLNYTFYADGDTVNGVSGSFDIGATVDLAFENGGSIHFFLKEDLTEPCKSSAETEIGTMEVNADGMIANPLYNDPICVNYRNKWGNNETMRNAVPYCYTAETYESYTAEQVQGWINTAEDLYEAMNSSDGDNDITIDSSYKEVSDVKNTEKLVCDAFSDNNYETMHKYYHIGTENVGNGCKVTCKEEIEVNFSDPVATQAGMCFQYLIEIKSKVTCDSSFSGKPPTRKQVCYPKPICINGGNAFDAGGPNDEFDSCVLNCDGGTYSQSCINKCYNKVYKDKNATKTSDEKLTKDDMKAISPLYVPTDSFYEATLMANDCSKYSELSIRDGKIKAKELYEYRQLHPGGSYKNGVWVQNSNNGCPSGLGPYYFRSEKGTENTISMIQGKRSYSSYNKYYKMSNGFLMSVHKNNTMCSDSCTWDRTCASNTVLTEALAQKEYDEAVQKYLKEKKACESYAATCSNDTTKYEIVVDNVDNDNDQDDDEEKFSSSQNMSSTTVNGDFPSMVILTDGVCEDGKDDPWNYHNIITFPGTWINNKTGQPVHSMDPDREDFYTYVGNQYCTKLNSVPINTAWYDWKVNQKGNAGSLTDSQKEEISDSIEMNINGHIDNYGYFGWNFDVSCFYAIGEPETSCPPDDPNYPTCDDPSCPPSDPNYPTCEDACPPSDPDYPDCKNNGDTAPIDDYNYRTVTLDNLFPNSVTPTSSSDVKSNASFLINEVESIRGNDAVKVADNIRPVGFNWTCDATNLENPDYIIQPVSLINQIQTLGDSIYEGDEYLDYHIRLTPEAMREIRDYNDKYDSYSEPTSDNGNEVLNAGASKTPGITVYRSYLLHHVLDSSVLLKSGIIGCNNQDGNQCLNVIDRSTACYNEYMAESAILKGAE